MLTRLAAALAELGFTLETSDAGRQRRWLPEVEVPIPEGVVRRLRSCMASEAASSAASTDDRAGAISNRR